MLEGVLELQGVVIEHLPLLWLFDLGGTLWVGCVPRRLLLAIDSNIGQLLFVRFSRHSALRIELKGPFDPLFLVRVSACCYDVLLTSCHASFDVAAVLQ